jgi:kinesin family protein C1
MFQQHTASPPKSPVKSPFKSPDKRPSILGPAPIFAIHEVEEPLTTSHLVSPPNFALPPAMAPLAGGAKRKMAETGIKPPASKRMTLADRAVAPKQFAAKPGAMGMTRSVSANLNTKTPTGRNGLSSTIGPGAGRALGARPIAAPRSRVVSAGGLSKSVGPTTRSRATPARATQRPPSRGESARPPSREETAPASASASTFKAKRPAWDTKGRLEDMELAYMELKEKLNGTTCEKDNMNDLLASERARCIILCAC